MLKFVQGYVHRLASLTGKLDKTQSNVYIKGSKKYELTNGQLTVTSITESEKAALRAKVESGDFDLSITNQVLYESSSNGMIQVSALGFNNKINPPTGLSYNRTTLQSQSKNKINTYLTKKQVTTLDKVSTQESSNVFPDGKKIELSSENYFVIVSTVINDAAYTIRKGEVSPVIYDDKNAGYSPHCFKLPPVLTGATDAGIVQYRDMTELIGMVRDVVVDDEQRDKIVGGFKQLAVEVSNQPSTLFGILKDVAIDEATAGVGSDPNSYGLETNVKIHKTTQATVGAIVFVITASSQIDNIILSIRKKALLQKKLLSFTKLNESLTSMTKADRKALKKVLEEADDELLGKLDEALAANPSLFDNGVPKNLDELQSNLSKGGKILAFSSKQIDDYVLFATKNADARKVMLGKYDKGGSTSYTIKAGTNYTFFDMGYEKWNEALDLIGGNEDEMWKINKKFIDDQQAFKKDFYFSHEPWVAESHEFLSKEAEYLIDLGAKDFVKEGDLWKTIW